MNENQQELARLKARIENLERSIKFGAVEFVLEDATLKQKPVRLVKRTANVSKRT